MLNRKTLTVLVSGVVGAVALLVFAPDHDGGRASPPDVVMARSANNDGAPDSGPTPAWTSLSRKAYRQGINSVRGEFRDEIQKHLLQLERPMRNPPLDTFGAEPVFYDGWSAYATSAYTSDWARMEARAIYLGDPVPDNFDKEIWQPLIEAAEKSHTAFADAIEKLEKWRDADFPEAEFDQQIDSFLGAQNVPENEREELRQQIHRRIRKNFERHLSLAVVGRLQSDRMFLGIAELAKIAKRQDLLEQVFKVYGGPLPDRYNQPWFGQDGKPLPARKFLKIGEFLEFDHRGVFEKKFGASAPPQLEPVPPKSKFPVTENEQKAIKDLLQELGDAIVAQDHEKLLSLHTGDMEKTRQLMREELASIKLYSFDMSQAQVEFVRDEENGPVRVEVNDFIIDREIAGKREKATSVNLYTVVFIDGRPKLRMFEE